MTPTAPAAPPLVRSAVDWPRLYREGLRLRLGAGEAGAEASAFVVPFAPEQDCIVLLIPCRRVLMGTVRGLLLDTAALVRRSVGAWRWLQGLGRGPGG